MEAHGGSATGPPNSWQAIEWGLAAGADLIEVDVQTSRDGVPFLFHNYVLENGCWTHELSWPELREVPADFPLVADVLAWAGDTQTFLVFDVKSGFRPVGAVHEAVAGLIASHRAADRVLVSNRDHHELRATKAAHPEIRTRAAIGARLTNLDHLITSVRPDAVTMRWDLCRQDDVDTAHRRGVAVTFVDGWHKDCVPSAVALGADAVMWHDPAEARALLASAQASR